MIRLQNFTWISKLSIRSMMAMAALAAPSLTFSFSDWGSQGLSFVIGKRRTTIRPLVIIEKKRTQRQRKKFLYSVLWNHFINASRILRARQLSHFLIIRRSTNSLLRLSQTPLAARRSLLFERGVSGKFQRILNIKNENKRFTKIR